MIWFAALVARAFLDNAFVLYPRTAHLESARTFAYAVKGIVVYLTHDEWLMARAARWVEVVCGVIVLSWILWTNLHKIFGKDSSAG
jgi:hypothetical protein